MRLLELADTVDLGATTYYKLSKKLNVNHPYKVKFALDQLISKGLLRRSRSGSIYKPDSKDEADLVNIPYYGEVNCGPATFFADNIVHNYLRVSPKVLGATNTKDLFALKAVGDSMNSASIHGNPVHNGDYVIVKKTSSDHIKDRDYVISIIGGVANLKKYFKDRFNHRIVLMSESKTDYPPIFINEEDMQDIASYQIAGKVVEVIPGFRD